MAEIEAALELRKCITEERICPMKISANALTSKPAAVRTEAPAQVP